MISHDELRRRQLLPLKDKIDLSAERIENWYDYWNGKVYVAFSGGKDSTVLLHLVRSIFPEIPAVFCDTGVEFPEIKEFVKTIDNVIWLRSKLSFYEILKTYGFPVVSKEQSGYIEQFRKTKSESLRKKRLKPTGIGRISEKHRYLIDAPFKISSKCCQILKKNPAKLYEKETGRHPFTGEMAYESRLRKQNYLRFGCNAYDANNKVSRPLSFWLEDDVWEYIKKYNIPYSSIYNKGYSRTGCVWCLYGIENDGNINKIQMLQTTHPQLHKYCIEKLGYKEVMDYMKVPYKLPSDNWWSDD